MRFLTFSILSLSLVLSATAPGAAYAQPAETAAVQPSESIPTQAQRLDKLFNELKRESNPDTARAISDGIRREWQDSGSSTINLLVQWAEKAASEDKNGAALDFLDEAIRLAPDYAEGWNRRATLHFKLGNYRKSMSDINRVLALEPRHFGAIAGMAAILSQTGRDQLALEAWERFLEIYPSERRAQKELGTLAEKLAGQRT